MSLGIGSAYAQKKVTIQILCETPEFVSSVLEKYKEKLLFIGLDTQHGVRDMNVSLFLNKESKSYSIIFTAPDTKIVCIASSGEMGEVITK